MDLERLRRLALAGDHEAWTQWIIAGRRQHDPHVLRTQTPWQLRQDFDRRAAPVTLRDIRTLAQRPLFDVVTAWVDDIPLCIKRCAAQPILGEALNEWSRQTNPSILYSSRRPFEGPLPPRLHEELLLEEARLIAASGGRWNHGLVGVARWHDNNTLHFTDEHLTLSTFDDAFEPIATPGTLCLVMPRWPGRPLAAHSLRQRRHILPALLPTLWDALCWQVHGDLKPEDLLIDEGMGFVRLLDPGVMLTTDRLRALGYLAHAHVLGTDGLDSTIFTTAPTWYPILAPTCPTLEPEDMDSCFEPLERYLELQWQANRSTLTFAPLQWDVFPGVLHDGEDDASDTHTPHPADLMALGLMYFEALAGRSLQSLIDAPWPLWRGDIWPTVLNEGLQPLLDALAQHTPALVLDAVGDIQPAEINLCVALIELHLRGRAELIAMIEALGHVDH